MVSVHNNEPLKCVLIRIFRAQKSKSAFTVNSNSVAYFGNTLTLTLRVQRGSQSEIKWVPQNGRTQSRSVANTGTHLGSNLMSNGIPLALKWRAERAGIGSIHCPLHVKFATSPNMVVVSVSTHRQLKSEPKRMCVQATYGTSWMLGDWG